MTFSVQNGHDSNAARMPDVLPNGNLAVIQDDLSTTQRKDLAFINFFLLDPLFHDVLELL